MKVMQMPMTQVETEEELISAFRAFDKEGNGKVTESELQTVMHTFGEPLNDDEIDALMNAAMPYKDGNGSVAYHGFAKLIKQG